MPTWRCENRCPTNDPLPPTRVFTASILFVQGAAAYIEYVLKYFSDKEANVMLKDVIVHIKAGVDGGLDDQIYEAQVMPLLRSIVELCLQYKTDFGRLVQ